ncbi:hypothetical protein [Streptomyces sp. NPDC054940]
MARSELPTWLQGAMDREPYRHNAFRISGLAVTATPRAVRRRVSEARAAEALGAERTGRPAAGESRWLPPDSMPDHNAVREALRRLEDPVRRVVDEFFWFWPLPESDGTELAQAREAWERLAGSRAEDTGDPGARSIAVHNLAVLHHAEALEAKEFYGARGLRTLWERAYRYWRQVLDDDGCWRRLDERIRVLDDPRLRVVDDTALREALPTVLLDLHARLAVDAARRKGGEDAALRHVSLMRGFAVNDGPADAGSVDDGLVDDGLVDAGSVDDGLVNDGLVDAGSVDDGLVNDGLVDAALRRVTAPFAAAVRHRTEAIPGPGGDPARLDRAAAHVRSARRGRPGPVPAPRTPTAPGPDEHGAGQLSVAAGVYALRW